MHLLSFDNQKSALLTTFSISVLTVDLPIILTDLYSIAVTNDRLNIAIEFVNYFVDFRKKYTLDQLSVPTNI